MLKWASEVGYEDINRTRVLAEIATRELGVVPEPSFGTHFFNDLVEANIVPLAIFPDNPETVFREEFFHQCPNTLASLDPELQTRWNCAGDTRPFMRAGAISSRLSKRRGTGRRGVFGPS